ncbi:MAG: HAD family phosphatase [Verrucomicrobiae bacterium]|nr:HAD family phosphatase [Verrucomicrobiae bacterium]
MKKRVPIKTILLDIGMVILKFDFTASLEKIAPRCNHAADRILPLIARSDLWTPYEIGRITTAQFACGACRLIGYRGSEESFIEAWCDIFSPNQPMFERIEQWHAMGIPLYTLSNTCDSHVDFFLSRYDIFRCFTDFIFSCRVGVAKPQPGIYRWAIDKHHADPATTLFLDDLPENVAGAQALGFHALQYQDEKRLAIQLAEQGFEFTAP